VECRGTTTTVFYLIALLLKPPATEKLPGICMLSSGQLTLTGNVTDIRDDSYRNVNWFVRLNIVLHPPSEEHITEARKTTIQITSEPFHRQVVPFVVPLNHDRDI
jgi:hypothetical protein